MKRLIIALIIVITFTIPCNAWQLAWGVPDQGTTTYYEVWAGSTNDTASMSRAATLQVSDPAFDEANPTWPLTTVPTLGQETFYAVKACNTSQEQCSDFSNVVSYNYTLHGAPQWTAPGGGGLRVEPSSTPGVSIIIDGVEKVDQTIKDVKKVMASHRDIDTLLLTIKQERGK